MPMDIHPERQTFSYTWHQSHDQATVILDLPYQTKEEDILVIIEDRYLVAGVRDQPPVVKGRLYGNVTASTSVWQLEQLRKPSKGHPRERTISTISSASTQFSYAMLSEPEISSSFAASLAGGDSTESEAEEFITPSPAFSSPYDTPAEDPSPFSTLGRRSQLASIHSSHPVSPRFNMSLSSSLSSTESLHNPSPGRLLTLHLEKSEPLIWPSLICGPAPETLSPPLPGPPGSNPLQEGAYNLDPTSLGLIGINVLEHRGDKDSAFDYLIRAWYQGHNPFVVVSLAATFFPILPTTEQNAADASPVQSRYSHAVGGSSGLAKLYFEAGVLHLEGAANTTLSSSTSLGLSSIRVGPSPESSVPSRECLDAWHRDRDMARQYFAQARVLSPQMNVPRLPSEGEDFRRGRRESSSKLSTEASSRDASEDQNIQMPTVDVACAAFPDPEKPEHPHSGTLRSRRQNPRREIEREVILRRTAQADEWDAAWYLYIPGLVGAGTALLVVGVVGALSFSSWRKSQG